jgi:formylglycine-generating enzyme required for sulfatase activity
MAKSGKDPLASLKILTLVSKDARWGRLVEGLRASTVDACLKATEDLRSRGDIEGALRLAEGVVGQAPAHPGASESLARLRKEKTGRRQFIELLASGDKAFAAGDFEEARKAFKKASTLGSDPGLEKRLWAAEAELALILSAELLKDGRAGEALDHLKKLNGRAASMKKYEGRISQMTSKAVEALKMEFETEILKAVLEGRLDDARTLLGQARALLPECPPIEALGREIQRRADCPEGMVYVAGGEYPVGGDDKRNPPRRLAVKPYYISKYEVSCGDFKDFVEAGGYGKQEFWHPEGWRIVGTFKGLGGGPGPGDWDEGSYPARERDLPVSHVSWYEADAYARFRGCRLPTEYEWEVAASYNPEKRKNRPYPWGDYFRNDRGTLLRNGAAAMVGVKIENGDRSPLGCVNMAGNAMEWTSSYWSEKKRLFVIRGSSASSVKPRLAALTYRRDHRGDPRTFRIPELGFRLAKDAR